MTRTIAPLFLSAALVAALALTACDNAEPATTSAAEIDYTKGANAYTVRGIVEAVPAEGPPPADLKIRHEHIPDFVGNKGTVHVNPDGVPGMKAMAMEFPNLAPGLSLDGIAQGDKVEFTFRVKWIESTTGGLTPRWQVTEISKLPAETPISFDNKTAPAETDGP